MQITRTFYQVDTAYLDDRWYNFWSGDIVTHTKYVPQPMRLTQIYLVSMEQASFFEAADDLNMCS